MGGGDTDRRTSGTTSVHGHVGKQLQVDDDTKIACLTLDLEDDWSFDDPALDHRTLDHLDEYVSLIQGLDVPISVFAVGDTIQRHPDAIETLNNNITADFHLHSHNHMKQYTIEEELEQGMQAFEAHFGEQPVGYRAPYGRVTPDDLQALDAHGFRFDSSVFPSYRPSVYSNLRAPREPFYPENTELVEFPIGTVPHLRVPVSQSYLKLLGAPYQALLKRVKLPNVLVVDSHLQDLFKTPCHDQLPPVKRFIHKRNMGRSQEMFADLVQHLQQRGYEFVTMQEAYERIAGPIEQPTEAKPVAAEPSQPQ